MLQISGIRVIEVGQPVTQLPLTDPCKRNYRTGLFKKLLASHTVFPCFLESMKYAWFGDFKTIYQFFKPFPVVAFALTAPVKPLEKTVLSPDIQRC